MQDLARKITALDTVIVHYGNVTSCEQRQRTYTSCGKVLHSRASQAPCSHHKHAGFFQGTLGICPIAGKDQLPTWIMGIGTLKPRFRSYWAFTTSFLSTRILLHLIIIYSLSVPSGNHVNKEAPSKMPLLFAVLAFPMHVIWAYKSVRGLRRRMKKLAEEAKAREKARLAAIDEATRLLDSADELELGHDDTRLAGAPSTRVTHRSMHAKARAMQLVSNAAYVLWHSAPEAWRQAYREELDFNKKQGIDPKDLRRSTLVRRALARHLLHGNKRGHNVPLVKEDDEDDDLEDWMSITSLDSFDHDKPRKGLQVSIGKGIRINMPRELDHFAWPEICGERVPCGSRSKRIASPAHRRPNAPKI